MAFVNDSNTTNSDNARIIKKIWQILIRNWALILLTYLVIVSASYISLSLVSNVYESSAQLLVKLGRENTQVPITVEKGDVYSTGVQKEEIHSYMRLLSSNEIINETIDQLGLDRFAYQPEQPKNLFHLVKLKIKQVARYSKKQVDSILIKAGLRTNFSEREKVFILLKRNLKVMREKDSNVISVSIRLEDPSLARDVVKTIIETYQVYHIRINKRENMLTVFDEQTRAYKLELKEKESEIETIKKKWGLSIPSLQIQGLVENIQSFKMTKDMHYTQKLKLQKEQEILKKELDLLPKKQVQAELVGQSPSSLLIKEELAGLKLKLAKSNKFYKADSQVINVLKERISDLKSLLKKDKQQVTSGLTYQPNPLAEEILQKISHAKVELNGIEASINSLNENISRLKSEISELQQGETILTMLQREYSILEQKFLTNASRAESVKVEHALDDNNVANIKVLSSANYPVEPVAPRKLLLMLIACVLGLFASIGLAMLRHWLLDKVYDADDFNNKDDFVFLGELSIQHN